MTPTPRRLLPHTLLGQIFALFAICATLYTLVGVAFFLSNQIRYEIDDVTDRMELLADTILPTLADSAVIGDYDTIERTLSRASSNDYVKHVRFTDLKGVIIEGAKQSDMAQTPPDWLTQFVAGRLQSVRREVEVGGRLYGTLELLPIPVTVAQHVWETARASLITFLLLLMPTLLLVRIPLRRTVACLSQATTFATGLVAHRGEQLRLGGAPTEIEQLTAALNQVSLELTVQHQAVLDSDSRKSAILEAGLDCFITTCDRGLIVDFNRSSERVFGYAADEVRGLPLSEVIIPHELRAKHEQGMQRWQLTGEGPILHKRIETMAMRRSGETFPIELTVVPFSSGERTYFAGFIRDISLHKSLEKQRKQLEEKQQQMMDDLAARQFAIDQHAAVSIAAHDGTIIYANQRLQDLSGYTADELLGKTHSLLKSGLQDEAFYREMWHTILSGRVWHGEYANRSKDGQIYWVAGTIVPMPNEHGKPNQFISIQTSITQQKRTEQQLDLYQEELLQLLDQYRAAEVEIGRRRAREMMVGAQIQRTLLFGQIPKEQGPLRIATFTQPSQDIDGDFYEFFIFDDNTFDIIIGDVMGKGVPAALMGAAVKQQLNRSAASLLSQNPVAGYKPSPEDIVGDLQQRIGKDLHQLDAFVTLSYLRIDAATGMATLVDAGHLPVIQATDTGTRLLQGDNLPVGVIEDETYRQSTFPIAGGDILFIFSDGITEARNAEREEFGIERLADLVQQMHAAHVPPTMIVQNIRWHVNEFENHAAPLDDRTCVALQLGRDMAVDTQAKQFELPRALDQLTPLRKQIEEAGARANLDETAIQSLVIAAFEAATNIVRHTPPRLVDATIHCALHIQPQRLELDLHYLGSAFTPLDFEPDFSGESEGGFGLYIIRNSVNEVEYTSPVDGICRIHLVKTPTEALP